MILSDLLSKLCDTITTTTTTITLTMPSPCSPALPPLPAEPTLARSRSRYKGPRLQKILFKPSETASFSVDHIQQLKNLAFLPCESRPENRREFGERPKVQSSHHETKQRRRDSLDDAQRSDAFGSRSQGSSLKAQNRTYLQDQLVSRPEGLQGYQQAWQRSEYGAKTEPFKGASKDTVPNHNVAASSQQCSHTQRPDLRPPHEQVAAATIETPAFPRRGMSNRIAGYSNRKRLHNGRDELKRTISAPLAIESPQNVAKPAFDAPVSAVNAGERRVKVAYDQNLLWLPVTPLTTPRDIIGSASAQLAESLDSTRTILFESFKQLGLERQLRSYEHVRDVLNSWDNDTQNTLIVKPSPEAGRNDCLGLHSVSATPPADTSVYIYYSQRPGHWDKRWVTLRSDGQMLVAKREGGENASICHLSDFDIYIPTARQSAKRIRPPRKICFAVKSQQKSSMFLSTANFVHFFSMSDEILAATWYRAVQEWRSWYLINVMGEGEGGPQPSETVSTKMDIQKVDKIRSTKLDIRERPPEPSSQGATKRTPTFARNDTKHLAPFRKPDYRHDVSENPLHGMPIRGRSNCQSLPPKKFTEDAADSGASRDHGPPFKQVIRSEDPEPFAATGLLGRTYTQRQRDHRQREKAQDAGSDQPVATPKSVPVSHVNRTLSQHLKPKPLIDLTPQYQEPPQHAKRGRGVILQQIPAGGLVEVANTPEAAIAIPPSTTWRRPLSSGGDEPGIGRARTLQQDHSNGRPSRIKQALTSPE